ncbi:hypothetical protein [Holdemania massiliensis]|uniref:Uncharacterized protein n=1 Tax=Holdemania massiliensis TaxID=1468449 RepID=A0A6N7SBA0_9FIRM|nr:hypothetical protein [Holdemania massiliensis]MSA72973.1 hypothetical protein [Holdemania massiliensis]MSA91183.1 hypothetical protein [Holdemania massiliensis]MSB80026.1 hypothetical protein [Holdemania massiliensis]MSC34947.1 hypothetical protein [Holdemania massiliensis]MSC41336.1 hypothetical protein [Holdemania massiliensis]
MATQTTNYKFNKPAMTEPADIAVIVNDLDLIDSAIKKVEDAVPDNYAGSSSAGGAASSAVKLQTARTIDGVDFNGASAISHYGTCSTAAATVAKVVACTGFKLVTGAQIIVKFTVTNTASNPTLNVNSSGAKAIQYRGSAISAGYLAANRTHEFVYDGSAYQLIGDIDTNTMYGNATQSKAGLMSATDKVKLDGIDDQINQEIDKKQNKILYGEAAPTADIGAVGDIYFQIEGVSN